MKVLVVDDESSKIKRIYSALRKIDNLNVEEAVENSVNLSDARRKLSKCTYDILIIDLNMPILLGEDLDEKAGLDLIEDILTLDKYNIPNEIIILTEYDDLKKQVDSNEYANMLTVLKYDDQDISWEKVIQAKIKFLLIKELRKTYADIVIITAVENEFNAVKRLFSWREITYKNDLIHYLYTDVTNKYEENVRLVLVKQDEMGMTAAATVTSKMILKFNPSYIIMCGIAACLKNTHNYGDIIIPYEIWNYSSGKIVNTNEEKGYILQQDPKYISIDEKLKRMIDNSYDNILTEIKNNWSNPPTFNLNILHGPMACGPSVVANEEYINEHILIHARKTIGLDMESYGLFYACNYMNKKAKAICIKSVSDFANKEKGDDYQMYASYTSASFAKYLIENILVINEENYS